MRWQDEAACRDADPAVFDQLAGYKTVSTDLLSAARKVARKYCAACPVIESCAALGDDGQHSGVYGGALRTGRYTRYQRKPLIRDVPKSSDRGRVHTTANAWGAA